MPSPNSSPSNDSSPDADLELVRQAMAGEGHAITRLFYAHYDEIYRYIDRRLAARYRSVYSVEDVIQETFIDAIRGIDGFTSNSPASFIFWLRSVADHRLKNCIRALNAKKRGGHHVRASAPHRSSVMDLVEALSDVRGGPLEPIERGEIIKAVKAGVSQLQQPQRQAVEMCYLDGKTVAEVAVEMKLSEPAVRGLLHRGKLKLRSELGQSSKWFHSK